MTQEYENGFNNSTSGELEFFKRADKIYAGSYIFLSGISQISKQSSSLNLQ